jgi:hypothetical protein
MVVWHGNRSTPLTGESERVLEQRGHSTKAMSLSANRLGSMATGKYPTKWTDLARKRGTLPSILDTGTHFSRKAAPHLASFIDVL